MITWKSSYEQHNYGELFYSLVRIYKPEKVVELGTKAGYSAYHMARALKENGTGTLDCYDLWEEHVDYRGSSEISQLQTQENLSGFGDIISLHLHDALGIQKLYETVDILHVDLDNDGAILEKIIPEWIHKVRQLIIIEGGSKERDDAASKTNFKKLPVKDWLSNNELASLRETIIDNGNLDQFVKVEGKKEYKEEPIKPWIENFCKNRGDIEYVTIEPFPSVTIIRKRI